MKTISEHTGVLVVLRCWCGIQLAVPETLRKAQLKTAESGNPMEVYCPLGHTFVPRGKTPAEREAEELRLKLDLERSQLAREKQRADHALRQALAARRAHKRMRDRVKNGVCPCCNRTFQNLLSHMRSEHPEYGREKTLRSVREAFGMTQADLANEIGINAGHISCFETGRSVTTWARDQIEAWLAEQQPA